MTSVSPIDGEPVWTGPDATEAEAKAALTNARKAFTTWRFTSRDERDGLVRRFKELVGERRHELSELITTEVGKTPADANSEINAIIGKAETSISARDELTGSSAQQLPAGTLEVTHRPIGPLVVLGPFNFPGHLPNGHITPALLAGNTVVFKPSELAGAVGQWMVDLWHEAGIPRDVLQIVHGGVAIAEALIDHPETAGVLFTGGVAAGHAIHRRLADRPDVMLALELGGNNPIIVWDAADLEEVSRLVVSSAFLTSGQRCTCARRLIVPANEYGARVVDAVVGGAGKLHVGSPRAEVEPFMGPVVSTAAAERVLRAQTGLVDLGATILLLAQPGVDGPAYVTPGVLDVTGLAAKPDEEIFGPVLQVIRVNSFEDAIAEANNTRFGLAAGVITDNDDLWAKARIGLEAGIINRNMPTVGASGAAPFGGLGGSGNHRPAGYTAAVYCADPVASLIKATT